ncbi:MAG TPA: rod shape-determining protein RodA [Acidobacteriota bacterium]|nr:rod shape-determining protein RodA [Acidobacteriota bacterium]
MPLISRRFIHDFDYLLLGTVLALTGFGILGVYSATSEAGLGPLRGHLIRIALGLALCLFFALIDYRLLTNHAVPIYLVAVAVLVATLVFGTEVKGSRSWIQFAGFGVQPSEMAKLAVLLVLAKFLGEVRESYLGLRTILMLAGLFGLPVLLVILQGDMGTAVMYFALLGGTLFVAGLKMRLIVTSVLLAGLLAPVGWFSLQDYQRERIMVTFNPEHDPQGVGYQVRQSKIAIGSGGLTGKGLGEGFQSQLGFVPEIQTDFIFALLAEEVGFLGGATVLLLFALLLMRILSVASEAGDRTGILIAAGVASLIFLHMLTNVGMTLGVLPAIGVPLPFVSYGGSSTLTMFAALGMVLSVRTRRFLY